MINPMAFGYDPKVEGYGYDPKKAKTTEAGWLRTAWISPCMVGRRRRSTASLPRRLPKCSPRSGCANLKIWGSGPAWNKFFQGEGKATNGFLGSWGYYSTFDADAILHPLYHTEPAAGWASGTPASRDWMS